MNGRPIANKYREGKLKRTLRRELKVPETGEREAIQASDIHTLPAHLQATKGILGGQRFDLFRLDSVHGWKLCLWSVLGRCN